MPIWTRERASSSSEVLRPARLSVNLNAKTADQLREITRQEGISITETVRRAIGLLHYVVVEEPQAELQVNEPDGSKKRIEFV